MKLIPLKYDFCIKEVMDNETVRKHFISDVLEIPLEDIKSVRTANPFLWRHRRKEKLGILDVRLILNDNTKINIEMQLKHHAHWENRTVFYLAKMFTADLRRGEKYKKLKKCVAITILDFKLDDRKDYHNVYMLRDRDGDVYTDILELHTIELKKMPDHEKPSPLDEWHSLFNAKTEEENPLLLQRQSHFLSESKEDLNMIKAKTKNLGIIEAVKELKTMSLSDRLYYMHEQHLKEKRDREWIEEDIYEQGLEKGLEKGREDGIKALISFMRSVQTSDEQMISTLMAEYRLSREEAEGKLGVGGNCGIKNEK